jgi:hypothetical protein
MPMAQKNNVCGVDSPDEDFVHDYQELTLTVRVPTNANSFSYNLNFMTVEYPEYIGSMYNDKFLALLSSKNIAEQNISFDSTPGHNPITVNVAFFDVCKDALICDGAKQNVCAKPIAGLNGTGYELPDWNGDSLGGGTGWLTTTAPVPRGETITLRFIIFDEGDHVYDSAVLLDNFQWGIEAAPDGPVTIQ